MPFPRKYKTSLRFQAKKDRERAIAFILRLRWVYSFCQWLRFSFYNCRNSKRQINYSYVIWAVIGLVCLSDHWCYGLEENQPIHFSGDRQIWNRKVNRVELIGHAAVNQTGESILADYILLDLKSRTLDARGNCIYMSSDSVIWGDEIYFNLNARTGSVINGRVSNSRFTLRGEQINKLGPGEFQAHGSSYTTCLDCSASWRFDAEEMSMQVEGYAYLTNVITKIKDIPAFWFPYLIVPVKTKRQTGILFPHLMFGGFYGTTFVLPFFWATSRNTDMTIGLGEYSAKGHRLEWEGRYVLSDSRNQGIGKFYFISDRTFNNGTNRWALDFSLSHRLPFDIDARLKWVEVSDNLYPFHYFADLPLNIGEAFLASKLIFNYTGTFASSYLAFQNFRNVLNTAPGGTSLNQQMQPDPRTVQAFPVFSTALNERLLLGNDLVGGLTFSVSRFTRAAGSFDYDSQNVPFGQAPPVPAPPFHPGIDPIRQATRFSLYPSLYTSFRVFDVVSVIPSLQFKGHAYDFGAIAPSLFRGYFLFQTDISTQLQKIYEFPNEPNYPRVKHIIRPLLTYSLIPVKTEVAHPFLEQIVNAQNRGIFGYNFDNNDIVPYTYTKNGALYFVPLGNSLSYGLTSQWIRRKGAEGVEYPTYENMVEVSAGQAINFLEIYDPVPDSSGPHILNRFFATLNINLDKIKSQTIYNYNPDFIPSQRTSLTTSVSYYLDKTLHQEVLNFERSISLGYTYSPLLNTSFLTGSLTFSLSDYILPTFSMSYNFITSQPAGAALGLQFQSPSRCWKLVTGLNYSVGNNSLNFSFDLQLNLTGGGFGGFGEIANQIATTATGGR